MVKGGHNSKKKMETSPVTHKKLIEIARRWLLDRRDCVVVFTELGANLGVVPDALGWTKGAVSTLIECKVSLEDLRADRKKNRSGLGNERYYLTPKGLITRPDDQLPVEYGLIEWDGEKNRVKRKAVRLDADCGDEQMLLLSALRRIGQDCPAGVSIRCYTTPTKNQATMTVLEVT